ncbi:hypothetical protein BH09PSE5_BH09PSE5_36110 [soil metagenome]
MIDPKTAYLIAGIMFVALPITTWSILFKRHDSQSVSLWCLGGLLFGIGFTLLSLRDAIDPWMAFVLGNSMALASYPMRAAALSRESGRKAPLTMIGLIWALVTVAYVAVFLSADLEAPRLIIALLGHLAGAAWLARLAWRLRRGSESRSAAMITAAFALYAATLVVRILQVLLNWNDARAMDVTLDFALIFVTGIVTALYGNIGYIGIALEASQSQELARSVELAREHEHRIHSELRVKETSELLAERGRLLAQREEMLGSLAHEVRQPLNNASAALQSATVAMTKGDEQRASAAARLQRASTVLTQVTSSLDNTLTDAVLLGSTEPVSRHDVDIDMMINLAVADIDYTSRDRIRRERDTGTRTASMNVGLIRLALRNLIANALAYGPAGSPVTIRVADSDDPLALVIEVRDEGPGFQAELLPKLFKRGARGEQVNNRMGHGLGLYIVKRVVEMHGGTIRVTNHLPRGMSIGLVIPQ